MSLSMPPEVWGPIFWATFHIAALAYPEEPNYPQKRAAKEWYKAFTEIIPCPICRKHYSDNLKETPIDPFLDNRNDLLEWTLKMHNKVNLQLGKQSITKDEFLKTYTAMCERGLPIPPSPHVHKIYETAESRAYYKGLVTGVLGLAAATVVGGAIYASYKK